MLESRGSGSGFTEVKSPTTAEGTLTGVASANGRLWTAGITVDTVAAEYAAFAAFAR